MIFDNILSKKDMNIFIEHRASLGLAAILVAAILGNPKDTMAAEASPAFEGEKTDLADGFDRYDFVMDEESLTIKPFKAPDGRKIMGSGAR